MKSSASFDQPVELKVSESASFPDGLVLYLRSFSHKRPMTGGPTKATAYLEARKGQDSEELRVSIHGIQGKAGIEEYEGTRWKSYRVELKKFDYDQAVTLVVSAHH